MRLSRYCFFHRNLIFNAVTGALVSYDEDTCMEIENNPEKIKDETILNELIAGGFLIDERIDEISRYLFSCKKHSFMPREFINITIAPTTECNARCFYCFEKGLTYLSMTKETASLTIDFIKSLLDGKKNLVIHWYGGGANSAA